MTEVYHSQVSEKESTASFRFRDGNSVKSGNTVTFTAKFGKKNMVKADVIDSNLPLLRGKSAIKKANENWKWKMKVEVDIVFTSSGH